MRIITLSKKNIYHLFFCLAFIFSLTGVYAQCPTVSNSQQSFCDNPYPTIASLVATNSGGGIFWYDTATSTVPLSNSIALVDGGDYFADDNTGACGTRQRVVVTIVSAPIVQPRTQGFCEESTISDLQAVGNMVQWYAAPSGGSPLAPNTILVDNTLYYASQISPITGCETSRRSVLVLVRILPAPTGNAVQQFCSQPPPTVANLSANGNNIRWYLSPSSGVELSPATPLIEGQTYYAATSDDLCESLTRLGVLVDFTEPNNAGTNGQRSLCVSDVPTTAPFNLFGLLGGTPDTIGTWTGPIATTNGHLGTVNISSLTAAGSPYVFTYRVASGVCPTVSATVTINILPLPVASLTVSSLNICSGENANIVITGTPNANVTYSVNGAIRTIQIPANGSITITGTYTTVTEIRLLSVTTAGPPSCSQTYGTIFTINVLPLPTATVRTETPLICAAGSARVFFEGTPGATVTYTENGVTHTIVLNASGVAFIDRNPIVTTTYVILSASSAGPQSCSQPIVGQIAVVNVIPPPTATISVVSADVCLGSNAVVTINGTPNATVIYTVNGSTRTAVLNAAGSYIVPPASYTENTQFILVSIITAGFPACTQPLTEQRINLVIRTLPTATIALGADTICTGATTTVRITGTPNADVVYTENGVSHTIRLDASGLYQLPTVNYNIQTEFILVSVTSTLAPFCSQMLDLHKILNVVPLPTVTGIAIIGDNPICAGTNATIRITGTPGAIVTYTENGVTNTITINAQGWAEISQAFTITTTFIPVSVSTSGSPGCLQAVAGLSATLTVIPLPIAAISSSADTICSGQNVAVAITGTPNAIVVYTANNITHTITLGTTGSYTIPTAAYTEDTEFVLVSITAAGTPACMQLLGIRIMIRVLPLPTATMSILPEIICANERAVLSFNGTPNAIITYTANGSTFSIALNAEGFAFTNIAYTVSTRFELVSAATTGSPGCSQTIEGNADLTVVPLPTAAISIQPATICAGETAFVRITGTPNAQVTYSQNGGVQTITLDGSGNFTVPGIFTVAVHFELISVATTGPASCIRNLNIPADLTVIPLPTASLIVPVSSICSGNNARVIISGTPGSIVTYTQNGVVHTATLNALGIFNIDGSYTETTTFILTNVALPAPQNCSQALNDTKAVTVSQPPIAGNSTGIEICSSSNPVNLFSLLGTSAQTGGTWLPALSSGTGIFNPAVDPAGQYQYIVLGTAPCPNAVAIVNVVIKPQANAGDDAIRTICSNQDPVDLFVLLGPNAQAGGTWFPALLSGTGVFNPAADPAQVYTYTVSGTFPCSSDQARVTVFITPGPDAGQPGNAAFCVNSASADLFLSLNGTPQRGGTWSPALASGTGIFNPAVDLAGVYTYTFEGSQPCDDDSATVTVTINPVPDAGDDGIAPQLCSNFPAVDLFAYLNGTPQPGGVWTPALASNSGIFNPQVDAPGVYTYTVGSELCQRDSATVTVTVTRSPNAGGLNAPLLINACINNTSVNLFTGLNGTQDAGGTWTSSSGAVVSNIFDATIGAGTYQFTYTVTGGVSPCESDAATITVIVSPVPVAGTYIGAPQNFCSGIGTINLFTLITGNQPGGDWTDSSGIVVNNALNISSMLPGDYSYTYSITNTCGTDTESVQFTIKPNPVLTPANITVSSPVCNGSDVLVNFNGLTDGNYLLTYNLSGSNVLADETINVTISGSTGSFNIAAADLPNLGTTTITFLNIANLSTTCITTLSNVAVSFVVRPVSNLENANLNIANICLGNDATVLISNANGLPDGNYQFNISIPQASPATATTAPVIISNGSGNFILPAAFFTTAGNYNLTITSIISLSSGCNSLTEDAATAFQVFQVPNITGAVASAPSSCVNFSNQVTISNATGLSDGTYTINYLLSGANTAAGSASITINAGTGSFTIAAAELVNPGNMTLTITQLTAVAGLCGATGTSFNAVSFVLSQGGTPTLVSNGNAFCAKDNPTVSDLSANISDPDAVIWYNSETGGTAYNNSDLLQNGNVYYASFDPASGCESGVRLKVTVDLTKCDDILIPDGFSPNGDGINDQFVINELAERFPNFKLEIYNRYGNVLYKGNINTPHWDGTSNEGGLKMGDKTLPAGVYFYILEFNDGIKNPKQGRVYLSR